MSDGQYEAIVVGGGPAGSAVARDVAAAGFRVAVLERHERIGQPVQCSGLVTRRTLDQAGLAPRVALNALRGAVAYAPSGTRYRLGGDRVHAYVMNRSRFDEEVMGQALETGLDLWTGSRVTAIQRQGGMIRLAVEQCGAVRYFTTRLVIGADGPRSLVAAFLQLPPPSEVLRARGADVRLPRRPSNDDVLLFFGERYAPGFFAWVIPLGGEYYRIGWGTSRPGAAPGPLSALVNDYPDVFAGIEIRSQTGGLIPLGPRPITFGEGGMVVGDAAGQAKATSGGGLYTSMVCARICAEVAISALTDDDVSAARLATYHLAWRGDIGRELKRASALRLAYRELSDVELEWGLRLLRIPGMRAVVDRYGDIDYPSRMATVALRAAPPLTRLLHGRRDLWTALQADDREPAYETAGCG